MRKKTLTIWPARAVMIVQELEDAEADQYGDQQEHVRRDMTENSVSIMFVYMYL